MVVLFTPVCVSLVLLVVDTGKLLVVVSVNSEDAVAVVVDRRVVLLVVVERVVVGVVGNGDGFCGSKYSLSKFRISSIHCQ